MSQSSNTQFPPGAFVMVCPTANAEAEQPRATVIETDADGDIILVDRSSAYAGMFGTVESTTPQTGYDVQVDIVGRGSRSFMTFELALVTLP